MSKRTAARPGRRPIVVQIQHEIESISLLPEPQFKCLNSFTLPLDSWTSVTGWIFFDLNRRETTEKDHPVHEWLDTSRCWIWQLLTPLMNLPRIQLPPLLLHLFRFHPTFHECGWLQDSSFFSSDLLDKRQVSRFHRVAH